MPTAHFRSDWLTLSDEEFRMMTLMAMCSDKTNTYQGTLGDICDFFGISRSNSRNNQKIQKAINSLEGSGLLTQRKEGRTYQLALPEWAP